MGNRIPLLAREMGRTFPKRANGKLRPTISFQSGTHFPVEGCSGKCIPELILRMGRRFPLRVSAENASRKWALSLDDAPPVPPLLKMRHAVGGNETRGTGHRTYYSWNEPLHSSKARSLMYVPHPRIRRLSKIPLVGTAALAALIATSVACFTATPQVA